MTPTNPQSPTLLTSALKTYREALAQLGYTVKRLDLDMSANPATLTAEVTRMGITTQATSMYRRCSLEQSSESQDSRHGHAFTRRLVLRRDTAAGDALDALTMLTNCVGAHAASLDPHLERLSAAHDAVCYAARQLRGLCTDLNPEHVQVIRHALGLDDRTTEAYRNVYAVAQDNPTLQEMERLGLVRWQDRVWAGNGGTWHVTRHAAEQCLKDGECIGRLAYFPQETTR